MFSRNVGKILVVTIAAAAMLWAAAPQRLAAATPDKGANVFFTATGEFAPTPVSGADLLKLAGGSFTVFVVGNSSATPAKHGQNWAFFSKLIVTGVVFSGLINSNLPFDSNSGTIQQTVGASADIFQFSTPVSELGYNLTISAKFTLPGGTLTTPLLRTFNSVSLDPASSTITYSDGTNSTVLGVQVGASLAATVPPAGSTMASTAGPASVVLLGGGQALKPHELTIAG